MGVYLVRALQIMKILHVALKNYVKSYRCPKFDGDAKQTLEIRVERKRNNRS